MISEELISDEQFNGLSLEAQNLFLRMLSKADDCGVVPASEYTLITLTNPPPQVRKKIGLILHEIVEKGLGRVIEHGGKPWFTFKGNSFLLHQGHILNHRKRSEYLKMPADEYDSGTFLDFPGFSSSREKNGVSQVASSKKQVESRKQKDMVPPTVEEVILYFTENGFSESLARRAFKSYSVADWHDSQGKKVMNWKQKMINVWFKEENKGTSVRGKSSESAYAGGKSPLKLDMEAREREDRERQQKEAQNAVR
jgi:hypothetical protein